MVLAGSGVNRTLVCVGVFPLCLMFGSESRFFGRRRGVLSKLVEVRVGDRVVKLVGEDLRVCLGQVNAFCDLCRFFR